MKKQKIKKDDTDVVNRLIKYQYNLYKGGSVKLDDIKVECSNCKVHFTPTKDRAKKLMSTYGVINKCRECENVMQ